MRMLEYEPQTGLFTWKIPTNRRIRVGSIAGTPLRHGHIHIRCNGKLFLAHRLAWLFTHGNWPTNQIDHINGVASDNRLTNLRESTQAQNTQNRRKGNTNSTSQFLGVHWCNTSQRWIAKIMLNGTSKYIGTFNSEEDAAQAYLDTKRKLHDFNTL